MKVIAFLIIVVLSSCSASTMLRRRRRRMHQDGIQPFLPADVNDPMVRESAEFVMKRLPLEPVSYTGFDVSGKNSYKISIAKVESQVSAAAVRTTQCDGTTLLLVTKARPSC